MRVLNLVFVTLISSLIYFNLMYYMGQQEPNIISITIMILSSLMFLAVMVVIILEATKAELLDDRDIEIFP